MVAGVGTRGFCWHQAGGQARVGTRALEAPQVAQQSLQRWWDLAQRQPGQPGENRLACYGAQLSVESVCHEGWSLEPLSPVHLCAARGSPCWSPGTQQQEELAVPKQPGASRVQG